MRDVPADQINALCCSQGQNTCPGSVSVGQQQQEVACAVYVPPKLLLSLNNRQTTSSLSYSLLSLGLSLGHYSFDTDLIVRVLFICDQPSVF